MSSKIGVILSMIFFTIFFLLSLDLILIQFIYSDLDAKSVAIGYQISSTGRVDDEFINDLEERYEISIVNVNPKNVSFGDTVQYIIQKDYKPIIVRNDNMAIKIKRETVIGFI